MKIDFFKVVAALPETLTANALYLVRAGRGFNLYAADATGSVAHPLRADAEPVYLYTKLSGNFNAPASTDTNTVFSTMPWVAMLDSSGAWKSDSSGKYFLVPRSGLYAVSVQYVYSSVTKAGFLVRLQTIFPSKDSRGTHFYKYDLDRADGKQFCAFTRIVQLQAGEKFQWVPRADGFTAYTLYENFMEIKTEATIALLAPL